MLKCAAKRLSHYTEREVIHHMADVQPLRGIRYAQKAIGDLAQVVTPPFDVISAEAQKRYYARNPYNVIRLELGEEHPDDTTLNNRYTRAAATLAEWRLKGILRQDDTSCYYMYQQLFTHDGKIYTRTSLLARVRLEPWDARVVLPHELTHRKAKDDRLKLLRACATNFSPLMCMYDDPQGRLRAALAPYAARAEARITDEVNEKHLLSPISDASQIELIQDFFAERQLYIADGHHRYETALNYRDEVLEQRNHLNRDDAINFVLMALIDLDDPGLLVLPTHRLLSGLSVDALQSLSSQHLARYFTVRRLESTEISPQAVQQLLEAASEQHPSFVVSTTGEAWLLSLNEQGRQRMTGSGHSEAWNELDVAVAHVLVLEELLGLSTEDMTVGRYVRYTDDLREALRAVQSGAAQCALLFHATRVRQICEVAKADDRMPQKSTYFYPKLITGLVMNPLW
jgi:uncharacterized protein (DUF1015 family)